MTEKGTYPVVGVIITDPQGRKMLRLGSDLDAHIALPHRDIPGRQRRSRQPIPRLREGRTKI